jgi:hypothetical protein
VTAPTLPAEQAAFLASTAAFNAQQEQLRNQLAAIVGVLWARAAASAAFSPVDAARFVGSLVPIAVGAQRAMSALTTAYYNRVLQPRQPIQVPINAAVGETLRGVDPNIYYRRPFTEVRWRLSQGKTLEQAVGFGRRRVESLTSTDLQLAHTHTAQRWMAEADRRTEISRERAADRGVPDVLLRAPREQTQLPPAPEPPGVRVIAGYRRVLSNRPNHCALCVLASTQRYKSKDLMPIHPGCGCTVLPVFDIEPRSDNRVLDPELAQQIHNVIRRDLGAKYVNANARDAAAEYRDIVVTNQHGELGPVLGVRGQHFERDPDRPGHLGHSRVNPLDEQPDIQNLDN